MYMYSRVPFVPLPVSVFRLLHVHGPWPRAPLSSERCVLHCVPIRNASVCSCMYVCVRVRYSVICAAAPVPVSMHTGWSCVLLSSLSLCLCLCDCGCNGSHVQLTEGLPTLAQPRQEQHWQWWGTGAAGFHAAPSAAADEARVRT
jgi:hypothetical protein